MGDLLEIAGSDVAALLVLRIENRYRVQRDRGSYRRMGRLKRRPGIPDDSVKTPILNRASICRYLDSFGARSVAFRDGGNC